MAATFPALLQDLLRADPGRPLVTFYDDATGERVELSVATYANWVAKTSSFFVDELDLERGGTLRVDLPTHWLGPVFLGAAWNVGLQVVPDGGADAVVCGPDGLTTYGELAGSLPVVACALQPLGVRFRDPLPDGVHDFGVEVWSQPDSFLPYDPPGPEDAAVPGTSQRDLLGGPPDGPPDGPAGGPDLTGGDRLVTTANPVTPAGLPSFVGPLVRGGSTVWVRHPDPAAWERRRDDERATVEWRPEA
ncbi:TIGR03089 family protein [Nocardioides guangzhouensis]|uniref:TIGR03089 family protein n=1 Tax=Nocardioides guangzhouensis TaxID=2497878 RepID=A0A4Q4Z7G8_9ACTN|nr:TIGR03089 family protein [Nocardioides guangzhouensis]RYP83702.1 TIGR03089 family protein [Nocardioides guangzhouensis]